jgi:hypothetical protein
MYPWSRRRTALVFGLVASSAACGQPSHSHAPPTATAPPPEVTVTLAPPPVAPVPVEDRAAKTPPTSREARVVLVTIDGVRWQDVYQGIDRGLAQRAGLDRAAIDALAKPNALTPHLHELVARSGTALGHKDDCGIVRQASNTNISLPGYYEIFTARRTRCMSNVCPAVSVPTILDRAAAHGVAPIASISSWDALERAVTAPAGKGSPRVFVSAGTTRWSGRRPIDDTRLEASVAAGEKSGPSPALDGKYRPDRHTAAIALEYLRAHKPRLLHVGLGDTDEWGHRDDYASYVTALRGADAFLGDLADALTALDLFESTTVIVTADHGRARSFREHGYTHPESGRSFVIAFGGKAATKGIACARRSVLLPDVGATVTATLGVPKDEARDAGRPIEDLLE